MTKAERFARNVYKKLRRTFRRALWRGSARYCPVCESRVREFMPFGRRRRENARCPVCGSLDRQRLAWVYLQRQTDLLDGTRKAMLHVAPEAMMEAKFRRIKNLDYLSGDLCNHAMLKMDITAIDRPDDSFDLIYCSHVLEHIPNDRKAMRELFRVLKPGGLALIQVPVTAERTSEDILVAEPEERERRFGQNDHYRRYGADFRFRLQTAGFDVSVVHAADVLDVASLISMGVPEYEMMFRCEKRALRTRKSPQEAGGVAVAREAKTGV